MCRKPCKECPWNTSAPPNIRRAWPVYVEKMESIGKIKNKRHACHMITSDIWGYKENITDNNVCIGSFKK